MAREPAQRTPAVRAVSAAVVLVVLFIASFAHPFGLPLEVAPLWQILAVLLIVGAVSFTNWACLHDALRGVMRRYDFEKVLIRIFKGLGFVVFTVIVAPALLRSGDDQPEEPAVAAG